MALWQWMLLVLAVAWAAQAFGIWLQMERYRTVFSGITKEFKDGFVGTGNERARFKKGAIAVVVISPELIVQRVLMMKGRSVFAKFKRSECYEGMTLRQLREKLAILSSQKQEGSVALVKAIAQIDKVRLEKEA